MTMTELRKSETRDKVIDWKILPPVTSLCNVSPKTPILSSHYLQMK
jgi:hypothetical protein